MKPFFPTESYRGLRICVALSGGRDSVALLHYFLEHAASDHISVSALTCEHGIRGEASLADLAFVQTLCDKWNVPLTVFRENVPQLAQTLQCGLEEAGRFFRYNCFASVITNGTADAVATAHHMNDYAETLLFRLCRGTALEGLNAFPKREGIIRPFLHVSRAQIDEYVRLNDLPFVEDESNTDTAYTRNALRHDIFPRLETAVPGAAQNLVRFAERATKDDAFLQTLARNAMRTVGGETHIPVDLPDPVFSRACVAALKQCGITQDYTQASLTEIISLKKRQGGRKVRLSASCEAIRESDELVFYIPQAAFPAFPFLFESFQTPSYSVTVSMQAAERALRVDRDAFPCGCVVRTRQEGDVFTPYSGHGKSLKKYLTDQKISARIGNTLPLIAFGHEILVICGVEISDRVKVTQDTAHVAYLATSAHR